MLGKTSSSWFICFLGTKGKNVNKWEAQQQNDFLMYLEGITNVFSSPRILSSNKYALHSLTTALRPKERYRNGKEDGRKAAGVKAFLQSSSNDQFIFLVGKFHTESTEAVNGCRLAFFSFLKTSL